VERGVKTHVKVCGLTKREDVDACLALGVDILGFNCWPKSPRYASVATLELLVRDLPEHAEVALIFVRTEPADVADVLRRLPASPDRLWIQLHGDEDITRYANLGARVLQVLRVPTMAPPEARSSRVLLDVRAEDFGGTGRSIDPAHLEEILPTLPREWLLAGGLDAANVASAIRRWSPWGVDVASGVEAAPGVKDAAKLAAFVAAVREDGGSS
jgi:phosphoribosylanthranilate isomerase